MLQDMLEPINRACNFLAGEFLLKWFKANGGTVVALRTLWVTFIFICFAVPTISLLDPDRTGPPSWAGLIDVFWQASNAVVIFLGGSYLALYARFVSQWGYLAGLYNQICLLYTSDAADE